MRKRKTLPKDFDDRLQSDPLDRLIAVFDRCELDARGGYSKQTAIGYVDCPDELITWLVGQGLDVDAADDYEGTPLWERASLGRAAQIPLLLSLGADIGRRRRGSGTPLHAAAARPRPEAVRVLLAHGADVHAALEEDPEDDEDRETPLLHGLRYTSNIGIPGMAEVAGMLIDAGSPVTEAMRERVRRIGKDFEFHRAGFNPDFLEETDAGLAELYRLFDVAPVAERRMHDGSSPITVADGPWHTQHQALWVLLVPSSGPAATVQGEVIRLTGRISREILDNGSPNWDSGFRAMLAAIPEHLAEANPLTAAELREAQSLAKALKSGRGEEDEVNRLAELAVTWVLANPTPLPLSQPSYDR